MERYPSIWSRLFRVILGRGGGDSARRPGTSDRAATSEEVVAKAAESRSESRRDKRPFP